MRAAPGWLRARWEVGVVVALASATLLVHDVAYVLSAPFWTDEAWVAVTTKYPIGELPQTTLSTPIGWSFLLRLIVVGGDQRLRLLPLAFAAGAVVDGYLLARNLDWPSRWWAVGAGLLAGGAVLFVPAMLVRNDLKQYTADACLALVVLSVLSRLERRWSRKRLAILALTCVGGMLVSHTTAFVGIAAFAATVVIQVARRAWPRVIEVCVAGASAAAGMLLVYEAFDARAVVPGLTDYWRDYYLPIGRGLGPSLQFLDARLPAIRALLGLGPSWFAILVIVAGLVTIARAGRPMVACAIACLAPEMALLSAIKEYPLLDPRTSTFLVVLLAVVGAIGLAGTCLLLARLTPWLALVVAAAGAAAFVAGGHSHIRARSISIEDVRTQTALVAARRRPDDVVLVNLRANWGFAYYWPQDRPSRRADSSVLQGYVAAYPNRTAIVVAAGRGGTGVRTALQQAISEARLHPGSKIWLIRSQLVKSERVAWQVELHRARVTATIIDPSGLTVLTLS